MKSRPVAGRLQIGSLRRSTRISAHGDPRIWATTSTHGAHGGGLRASSRRTGNHSYPSADGMEYALEVLKKSRPHVKNLKRATIFCIASSMNWTKWVFSPKCFAASDGSFTSSAWLSPTRWRTAPSAPVRGSVCDWMAAAVCLFGCASDSYSLPALIGLSVGFLPVRRLGAW